jgi:hypothetical protein
MENMDESPKMNEKLDISHECQNSSQSGSLSVFQIGGPVNFDLDDVDFNAIPEWVFRVHGIRETLNKEINIRFAAYVGLWCLFTDEYLESEAGIEAERSLWRFMRGEFNEESMTERMRELSASVPSKFKKLDKQRQECLQRNI